MIYINMDHAGWVERQIAAHKRTPPRAAERRSAAEHRGWYAAPDQLNEFQRRAIDILGIVGGGIYNAPISWRSTYWSPRHISVTWHKGLGTFDFDDLTGFVLLCHEGRIRGYVAPYGFQYLELTLSERAPTGDMSRRHPNIEEMLAWWRTEFPNGHSICYRAPSTKPQLADGVAPARETTAVESS